jgi:hypothetical protein
MTSMKKKLNYKVLRLNESYNFQIKFIFIRVHKKLFLKRSCPTSQHNKDRALGWLIRRKHAGLGSVQLAQQVLAKKLGALFPDSQQKTDCNLDFDLFVQRLSCPFNKYTMEALQVLVEEGNKA